MHAARQGQRSKFREAIAISMQVVTNSLWNQLYYKFMYMLSIYSIKCE